MIVLLKLPKLNINSHCSISTCYNLLLWFITINCLAYTFLYILFYLLAFHFSFYYTCTFIRTISLFQTQKKGKREYNLFACPKIMLVAWLSSKDPPIQKSAAGCFLQFFSCSEPWQVFFHHCLFSACHYGNQSQCHHILVCWLELLQPNYGPPSRLCIYSCL